MTKNLNHLILICAAMASGSAFAYLPGSAINNLTMTIYGVYTTSDATCQTGLLATVPLSATPQTVNMTNIPNIGQGPVANPINCVIMVVRPTASIAWVAGTYTGTTNTYADTQCNAGGTIASTNYCGVSAITWPGATSQLVKDMTALGLAMPTACANSATDIAPLYLSVNAGCTYNTGDPTACKSPAPGADAFQPPSAGTTTASDNAHGVKLAGITTSMKYKFIMSPANVMGGSSGGTCSGMGTPTFSFASF